MKKSDWKLFMSSTIKWRERYLTGKNKEIITILKQHNSSPTEIFYEAMEFQKKQRKILVDCLDGYTKSNMDMHLISMYRCGMVDDKDLLEFSSELREYIYSFIKQHD